MEEYQKVAVDRAIQETWKKAAAVVMKEVRKNSLITATENFRKQKSLVYPGWVTLCLEHRSPPGSLLQLVSLSLLHRV